MSAQDKEYRARQAACTCLPPERRAFIEAAMDFAADFSDGAFMAYMEEKGIDVGDLEAFSIEHDCRPEAEKPLTTPRAGEF